jgi:hypothetical protein
MMKNIQHHRFGARFGSCLLAVVLLSCLAAPLSADSLTTPLGPETPGVYFENGGQHDWVALRPEQAKAATLTAAGAVTRARLDRGYSRAVLYAPLKLAVKIHEMEDINSYRVYRLRCSSDNRDVRLNKPVAVEWVETGLHFYELRLPAGLKPGDYAILPPGESADRIYAFTYRVLPGPSN